MKKVKNKKTKKLRRKITKVRKRIMKISNKLEKKGGWVEIIIKKLIKNKDKFY